MSNVTSRSALGVASSWEGDVLEPFLLLMGMAAGAIAAVALLYTMLALFRQQTDQFATMRAVGQTKRALAVDLSVLFAAPLAVAAVTALSIGTLLALACNLALDVARRDLGDNWGIAVALGIVAALATALVTIRAMRVEPLVRDPEAMV